MSPARCAAKTLFLMPPTGSANPRNVSSPVRPRSLATRRPVNNEAKATSIATPGRRTIFRSGTGRDMDVHVMVPERTICDSQLRSVTAQVRHRCLRRFLHHVTELTRQAQLAFPLHSRRLDEQDVASGDRPREADRNTRSSGSLRQIGEELYRAQEAVQMRDSHIECLRGGGVGIIDSLRHQPGVGTANRRDLAFEPTHSSLLRVVADNCTDSVAGEAELLGSKPVIVELSWH